jgi:putative transposase
MYSNRFNKKHGFVGHLWQERPFSCVLAGSHLLNAIRYVELNPVRAGIVGAASDYRWSSARSHCMGTFDPLLDPEWGRPEVIPDWAAWLAGPVDPESDRILRARTMKGIPFGDEAFVQQVATSTGRNITLGKPGRKPIR